MKCAESRLNKIAVADTALFFDNRKLASNYVYEVYDALVKYLEPHTDNGIEVVSTKEGAFDEAISKSYYLENRLKSLDPNKYDEFECGIKFNFKTESYKAGTTIRLGIFISERKCKIFGKTFLLSDGNLIGQCAYEFIEKRYDPKQEKLSIGFVR